ncbi:MAG: hypothetical protein HY819_15020 [Acidobacteria bacterium]|nr:hypothetical protein [Acidobacteriota bacterium]
MQENTGLIIKEKTPINYILTAGLITFVPLLLIFSIANASILSLSSLVLLIIVWSITLGRGCSLQISKEGIRQYCCGIPLFLIKWNEVASITYSQTLAGPRYRIRSNTSPLAVIDLPVDDGNFPIIKQAIAEQGVILSQSPTSRSLLI